MKVLALILAFAFAPCTWAKAKKAKAPLAPPTLADRVVTISNKLAYDEVHNKAVDEMLAMNGTEKAKLSQELEIILLKDKKSDRRENAATALAELCDDVESNAEALAKAVTDKDRRVRQSVASALGRCGASSVTIGGLKILMADKDENVRTLAEMNLERFGTREAKAALKGK